RCRRPPKSRKRRSCSPSVTNRRRRERSNMAMSSTSSSSPPSFSVSGPCAASRRALRRTLDWKERDLGDELLRVARWGKMQDGTGHARGARGHHLDLPAHPLDGLAYGLHAIETFPASQQRLIDMVSCHGNAHSFPVVPGTA